MARAQRTAGNRDPRRVNPDPVRLRSPQHDIPKRRLIPTMSATPAIPPAPSLGPIVSLQAHILQQQATFPEATGTLSWILSALSISSKIIASKVRRARLENVLGTAGSDNVQGEQQQKLDVIANEVLLGTLGGRDGVAIVASEEN